MRRRPNTTVLVLLTYIAISFLYFGIRLVDHPGRELVGAFGANDDDIFVWCFAWWPHAILHGLNPFFSRLVYAPTGTNLAWVTSVPALAIAFSPLTLIFGPDVGFNAAIVLMPALSAWAAYLLCRYLTRSTWASLVGGYLFGFSTYTVSHMGGGHLNLVTTFVVPLVALVVVKHVRGELSSRGFVWRFGLLLALEAYISTEIAVTLTLMLVLGLALAAASIAPARAGIRALLLPVVEGYALAGVLAAPLLYYAITGFSRSSVYATSYDIDPLNLVVPTRWTQLGGSSFTSISSNFRGGDPESSLYVGVPVLLVIALLIWRRWRSATVRFLAVGFVIATILSFGSALYVNGRHVVWLPWAVTNNWIGFSEIVPTRFSLYAWLAVGVMVALWIASARSRVGAYVLPALVVAALVPAVWSGQAANDPARIAFFSDHLYKVCIPRGETLMVFPFGRWGESMLWQAESNFWFKIPEGTLGHNNQPATFVSDPTVFGLLMESEDPTQRPNMAEITALAKRRHVDRIVSAVDDGGAYPSGVEMHAFGPLQVLGDAYVAPACGYDSLAGDKRPPPSG